MLLQRLSRNPKKSGTSVKFVEIFSSTPPAKHVSVKTLDFRAKKLFKLHALSCEFHSVKVIATFSAFTIS